MIMLFLQTLFSKKTWKVLPYVVIAVVVFLLYSLYSENKNLKGEVKSYKSLQEEKLS
jgi:hypothetical protein